MSCDGGSRVSQGDDDCADVGGGTSFPALVGAGGALLLASPSNCLLRDLSNLAPGLRERLPTPVLPSGGQKLPRSGRRGEQGERRGGERGEIGQRGERRVTERVVNLNSGWRTLWNTIRIRRGILTQVTGEVALVNNRNNMVAFSIYFLDWWNTLQLNVAL